MLLVSLLLSPGVWVGRGLGRAELPVCAPMQQRWEMESWVVILLHPRHPRQFVSSVITSSVQSRYNFASLLLVELCAMAGFGFFL